MKDQAKVAPRWGRGGAGGGEFQGKCVVWNFVFLTESLDHFCFGFWLVSSYKQFILGHSTELFVAIQKAPNYFIYS